MTEIKLGRYRHFKGKEYEVIGVARDCEDPNKEYVVYRALYDSKEFGNRQLWIRSLENFLETVLIDVKEVKRFEYLGK